MYNSDFIVEWNSEYPLDRWWRKKHGVPFNSTEHRSISPQDMLFEFLEDAFYKKIYESLTHVEEEKYIPGSKTFLKGQEVTAESFEEIDLDMFNFKK